MVIAQFCLGILLLLGIKTFAQPCPYPDVFYIKRGVNTYCQKIYNCKPGYEIRHCDKTCEEEKCVPCPKGLSQPYLSHSDDPIQKRCFKPEMECSPRDTIPVENGTFSPSCARQKGCACDHSKCFHGNPCICERNFTPCGLNEEMNYRGECVKCMEGYTKPYSGCDQCERIVPTPPPPPLTHFPINSTPSAKGTTKSNKDTDTTTKSTKYSSLQDHTPSITPPTAEPGAKSKGEMTEEEEEGQTLIIVFVVIGVLLLLVVVVVILLYRCKSGRRRIMKKICREREADEPERINGDLIHEDQMDMPEMVPTEISHIREPLMRISIGDSGYEPHHPSLDSQISQTSHISVSTPVQVTDGGDDFHPLMRTISHDPDASSHSALITSSSPITEPSESPSFSTSTLDRPSMPSMAVSEPINQEINLDVKGTIPSDGPYITDEIGSGHDEIDVRIGRTATENEEDTQEKGKESAHHDSLPTSKQQS